MNDHEDEKMPDTSTWISPLATPEEKEAFLLQRELDLKQIIEGPSPREEWRRAVDQLDRLRSGYGRSDEEEWYMGR